MKNLKFLLILSLAITVFSCKKNDDTAASSNADLVGTWTLTTLTGTATGNAVDSSTMTTQAFTGVITGKNITATASFTENPNNVAGAGTYDIDLVATATTGGGTQTVSQTGQKIIDNSPATWTRVATLLTILDGTETLTGTVNISGNTMTVVTTSPLNIVDGTVTSTGTSNVTQTYTKQ